MKVEMVAREVGEHDGVELDARAAVEGQGVRGDLERARPVAAVPHLAKHALQVERLGGGELDGSLLAADPVDDGAEQAAGQAGGSEDAGHEVAGRRLAVGAGHADDAKVARRMPVPARRHERQGAAAPTARSPAATGAPVSRSQTSALAPAAAADAANAWPSHAKPGDAKEKRAVCDVTRVVGKAPDDGGRIAAHRSAGDPAGPARQAPSPKILSDPPPGLTLAADGDHGAISRRWSANRMIFCTAGAAMSPP